jgi:2-hydroxychromene-2-carboxylate isomerase
LPRSFDYFLDFASPYTYLAHSQIPGLVERTGARVVYKPMVLGAVMVATGNAPPSTVAAKGAYMSQDIQRWLRRYDLPFEFNPHFPVKTIFALRCALVALDEGGFDALAASIFRAVWTEKIDPSDVAAMKPVIERAGLDADHVTERTADPKIKDLLKANTDEAIARGVFGAPTIFIGDEMFFGNDRLGFVEEALA